ncbi:hypothetical protein K438DRAFT_1967442 [Mycena galopus ATCC 62051]|nr:hypothetical protein K438DRAFT_1967442 [Mycena galopus ATCC 62051]
MSFGLPPRDLAGLAPPSVVALAACFQMAGIAISRTRLRHFASAATPILPTPRLRLAKPKRSPCGRIVLTLASNFKLVGCALFLTSTLELLGRKSVLDASGSLPIHPIPLDCYVIFIPASLTAQQSRAPSSEQAESFRAYILLPPPRVAFTNVIANQKSSSQISPWNAPDSAERSSDVADSVQHQRRRSIQRMHSTNGTSPRGSRRNNTASSNPPPSSSLLEADNGSDEIPNLKPNQVAWFFALLPFQLGTHTHPTNGAIECYSFHTNEDGPQLLDALTSCHLITYLILEKTATGLWRHFDGHIRRHLAANTITFPSHPKMKAANTQHQRKLTPSKLNMERDFDIKALSTISGRHRHPTTDVFRLLFVAPRHGNASGPFDDFFFDPVPHACLPWRVFWGLEGVSDFNREEGGSEPSCLDGCPATAAAEQSSRKRDASSPAPDEVPEGKRSKVDDEEFSLPSVSELLDNVHKPVKLQDYIEIDDDLSDAESGNTQAQQQQTLQQLLAAANETVATQSSADIVAWRGRIYGDVEEDSLQGLSVSGPTTLSIAETLITAIDILHSGQEFKASQAETGVLVDRPLTAIRGIIHGDRLVQVYSPNPEGPTATGPGPENSVFVRGLALRLSDKKRWIKSGGVYFRPQFYGLPIRRHEVIASFKVDGTWAALYMIQVGLGPEPICPFLLLAVTQRDSTWLCGLTLAYINALDPSAAKTLAPWFAINAGDIFDLSKEAGHPGIVLALTYVSGIEAPIFATPRTEEVHNFMHVAILTGYFFGVPDPWGHAEFQAFATGFAIELASGRTMLDHCADFAVFKARLVPMYNQRISNVQDVIDKLQFTYKGTAGLTDKELLQAQMFQLRLLRWIRGTGYPRSIQAKYITAEEYKAHRNDPLIRAQRLLFSMTERYAVPLDPDFHLTVCLYRGHPKGGLRSQLCDVPAFGDGLWGGTAERVLQAHRGHPEGGPEITVLHIGDTLRGGLRSQLCDVPAFGDGLWGGTAERVLQAHRGHPEGGPEITVLHIGDTLRGGLRSQFCDAPAFGDGLWGGTAERVLQAHRGHPKGGLRSQFCDAPAFDDGLVAGPPNACHRHIGDTLRGGLRSELVMRTPSVTLSGAGPPNACHRHIGDTLRVGLTSEFRDAPAFNDTLGGGTA